MKIQIAGLLPIVMGLNLILTTPLAAIDSDDEGNTAQVPPAPLTPPPQLTNTGDQKSDPLSPGTSSSQNDQVKALLCVDVWEHAYYIDYRNLRPKFVETFLDKLVNWSFAEANFA